MKLAEFTFEDLRLRILRLKLFQDGDFNNFVKDSTDLNLLLLIGFSNRFSGLDLNDLDIDKFNGDIDGLYSPVNEEEQSMTINLTNLMKSGKSFKFSVLYDGFGFSHELHAYDAMNELIDEIESDYGVNLNSFFIEDHNVKNLLDLHQYISTKLPELPSYSGIKIQNHQNLASELNVKPKIKRKTNKFFSVLINLSILLILLGIVYLVFEKL